MAWVATWFGVLVSGVLWLGIGAGTAGAQDDAAQTSADAMQQLSFLVGQWQGAGWIELGPGRRVPFVETETAAWKLGGLALLIEGRGTQPTPAPPAEAAVVHDALALITFDAAAQQYAFRAYQASQGAASGVAAPRRRAWSTTARWCGASSRIRLARWRSATRSRCPTRASGGGRRGGAGRREVAAVLRDDPATPGRGAPLAASRQSPNHSA